MMIKEMVLVIVMDMRRSLLMMRLTKKIHSSSEP
jgi:hypothetical protein